MADLSARPFRLPVPGSSADRLLDKAIDYVVAEGDPRQSLRSLAEAIGTSHRMLQYHFGSKERLLGAALLKLRARYAEGLGKTKKVPSTRAEHVRNTWDTYRAPGNFIQLELLLAVTNPAAGAISDESLINQLSGEWTATLVRLGIEEGLTPERAQIEARLIRNAWRGLHQDLYASRQTAEVDAAAEVLIEWISSAH